MKVEFADTSYWVALIDAKDQWHEKAAALSRALDGNSILTTDEVLTEVLAFFSAYSSRTRQRVSQFVFDPVNNETHVEVIEQSRASFWPDLRCTKDGPTSRIVWLTAFQCNS